MGIGCCGVSLMMLVVVGIVVCCWLGVLVVCCWCLVGGIPYMLAPEEQTHVGAMLWFGQQSEQRINTQGLRENAQKAYSHDNLFHTILGLTGVQTAVYNPSLDMLLYKQ